MLLRCRSCGATADLPQTERLDARDLLGPRSSEMSEVLEAFRSGWAWTLAAADSDRVVFFCPEHCPGRPERSA